MRAVPYYWDDRDDVHVPVHLVGNEDEASHRVGANCGATPGELGWVIWYGNVPDRRKCEICFSRPMQKLPEDLSEAQLDGRACIRYGHEPQPGESVRPVEAWSRLSSQLFECVDTGSGALLLVRGLLFAHQVHSEQSVPVRLGRSPNQQEQRRDRHGT